MLVTIFVLIAGASQPIRSRHAWGYTCRLCGATWTKKVSYIVGIPVRWTKSKIYRQSCTQLYDEYIAEPHRHQWAGGGHSVDHGNMFGYGGHSDGAHAVPPYPIFQPHLTRIAIYAAADLMDEPAEVRKRVFHEILSCTIPEEFQDVCETRDKSIGGDREQVWRDWLASRSKRPKERTWDESESVD